MEREFLYPALIPKLTREHAVIAFFNYKFVSPSWRLRVPPLADFDAPPTLLGLLRQSTHPDQAAPGRRPLPSDHLLISVHRATAKGADTEIARLPLEHLEATPPDVSKWPALQWGDVVVFTSDDASYTEGDWLTHAARSLRRTVTLQYGDRTATLTLADPAGNFSSLDRTSRAMMPPPPRPFGVAAPRQPEPILGWSPELASLPNWTLAELLLQLTDAEPRAQLDAVRVERTIDGKTQTWTADLRAVNPADALPGLDGQRSRIKKSAARLADGDRLVIPLLPASDAATLAARREFIGFAAPGRNFAEQVFTQRRSAPGHHTLSELVTMSYAGPMIVPYPDFSRVTIHRLKGNGGEEEAVPVDLNALVNEYVDKLKPQPMPNSQLLFAPSLNPETAARNLDVPLQWGDVVEVATIDHADPTQWNGLGIETITFLYEAGSYPVLYSIDGGPAHPISLSSPRLGRFNFMEDLSGGYPSFGAPGRSMFSERMTALNLLRSVNVDFKNLASLIVQVGDAKRDYNAAQLEAVDPWITAGSQLFIRKLSP